MVLLNDKKGQDLLAGNTIFVILTIIFVSLLLLFLARLGTGADIIEKTSVRQIALTIDSMKPGTEAVLYLPKLFDLANKNGVSSNLLDVDYENGKITAHAVSGNGNSFYYLTKLELGSVLINEQEKTVTIKT
ncbi:MAG: hypothetical protein Q8L27_00755 [archaeon]|nr:hypothetical protein [archaeon]